MESREQGERKEVAVAINMGKTGENIKRLVQNRKIGVQMLSRRLGGVSAQAIYKWYRGDCLPSLENLFLLKKILELDSIEALLIIDELIITSVNTATDT